jgi:hypothetical protein
MFDLKIKSSGQLYFGLAFAIILAPMLYLFTSHEWLYSPLHMIDAYLDQTYSFFYPFGYYKPHYYKAARVPWISALFYLQNLVGPFLLMPVVTCLNWISLGLLYFVFLKKLFGHYRALCLLPWIVFFPHITGSSAGGGLYNNLGAMPCFILSLYFWVSRTGAATRTRELFFAFLTGIFFATAVYTNIIYINLTLLFPLADNIKKQRFSVVEILSGFIGILAATVMWGLVNVLNGRHFFFFADMVRETWTLVSQPKLQMSWWTSLTDLLFIARHETFLLMFLLSLFLIAFIKYLQTVFKTRQYLSMLPTLNFIFIFLVWVAWHCSGTTALSPPDFIYPLELPAIIMIASWMTEREFKRSDFFIVAGSAILLWLLMYGAYAINTMYISSKMAGSFYLYFLALMLMYFIFCVQAERKIKLGYYILMGVLFSFTSLDPHIQLEENCTFREDSYKAVTGIVDSLSKLGLPGDFITYAEKDSVIEIKRCYWKQRFKPLSLARTTGYIIGDVMAGYEFERAPENLKESDFKKFHYKLNLKMVLFPNSSTDFSSRVVNVAKSYGFRLEKIYSSKVAMMDHEIPYEVYSVNDMESFSD